MTSSRSIIGKLTSLVADLQRDPANDDQRLTGLVNRASQYVPGMQYAGVTVVSRSKGISTAAATHRYPVVLDEIQQQHQEGPCLSAAWEHHLIRIDDLAADDRWPRYRRDALDQTPIRSILSFELSVNHDGLSALTFYAERPHAFDDESVELGLIVATHTALAWTMARRHEQFRSALASRDIIGQAKGMVMERLNIDAVSAFEVLARLSQESNIKLVDVARQLIDREHPTTRT